MPRDHVFSGPQPGLAAALAAWRHSLGELALACAGSYAADEAARLRDLAALLLAAPAGQIAMLPRPDLVRLEVLLDAGAGTSAALELIGGGSSGKDAIRSGPARSADAGYLLSCGGSGQHMASVVLPGATEETTASGDTAALALVGALALALADQAGAAASLTAERRAQPRGTPH